MSIDEVEKLPITQYKIMLEQAVNIGALYRQGAFEFQDEEDKTEILKSEIEFFKERGTL